MYEGNSLFVDYTLLLDVAIPAWFSHSNGESSLHVSESLAPWHPSMAYVYMIWYFHPLNPWIERFDRQLHRAYDAGLRHEWMKRAR